MFELINNVSERNYCGFLSWHFCYKKIGDLKFFFNLLFSSWFLQKFLQKFLPICANYALPLRKRLECSTFMSPSKRTFYHKNNQQNKQSRKIFQEVHIRLYKPRRWRRKRSTFKFRWPGTFRQQWKGTKDWEWECWPKTSVQTVVWWSNASIICRLEKQANWKNMLRNNHLKTFF